MNETNKEKQVIQLTIKKSINKSTNKSANRFEHWQDIIDLNQNCK